MDDGLSTPWYRDADNDRYGSPLDVVEVCPQPDGHVARAGDCDDARSEAYPGAVEQCNELDDDCDGIQDEEEALAWYKDLDGDGFGTGSAAGYGVCAPSGYSHLRGDCDDEDVGFHPGAPDPSADKADQDCGGSSDPDPHVGFETSTFTSIQSALDAASDGFTVWVAPGVYLEYALRFGGKGLTLAACRPGTATLIDAERKGSVFIFDKAEPPGAKLDGFKMINGHASYGSGIYVTGSILTISGCEISSCWSVKGGGIAAVKSNVVIEQSIIQQNRAALASGYGLSTVASNTVLWNDVYSFSGQATNLGSLDPSNLAVEPRFLRYALGNGIGCEAGSSPDCIPIDFHLALDSPLINVGAPDVIDPDGTRADMGLYGGPDGDLRDMDGDGYYDWFWPGTIADAPEGFDPSDWDCDDRSATVQNCAL